MPGPRSIKPSIKPKIEPGITIKQEPMTSSSQNVQDLKETFGNLRVASSRLASFKGPRDLTLSVSSTLQPQAVRPKKAFLPNIPPRREKVERVVESRSEKSSKRSPAKFKQDRGRGRGRGREKEYIQTKGSLFGEGIAASAFVKRNSHDFGGYSSSRGSKIGEMQKPVLNPDAAYNIDQDAEDLKLKEILRDDFVDDLDDDDDIDYLPVQLPLVAREKKTIKAETKIIKKKEDITLDLNVADVRTRVKREPGLDEEEQEMGRSEELATPGASVKDKYEFAEGSLPHQLFTSRENEFYLFQLPTCLPGLPPEVTEERPKTSSGLPAHSSSQGASTPAPRCTLDTLKEGKIGEIKIYESGKIILFLGEFSIIINQGIAPGFLEDCVKIDYDSDMTSGDMTILGHVIERIVGTPDFEAMIKNIKKS